MSAASARRWAQRWGSNLINLGDAGHINAESGFGPLPFARRWVLAMEQRMARERRPRHASFSEWSFAV
jgi:predicted alpha/beta hydrolase family esterase